MVVTMESSIGKQWDTFDVQTAATVYWKKVPVLSRMPDREEHKADLTVRIMTGVNRNNHNARVLRIHLSNEEDLFFLNSLEVSEEEFQTLKIEQGILVDFANFPGKIVGLLERCLASRLEDTPKFQAVLSGRGGDTILQIVETNDFKQLPHISLAFRQGNDAAVKQFLAHRLTEVLKDCSHLSSELSTTKEAREVAERDAEGLKARLASAEEAASREAVEREAATAARDAHALQQKTQEIAALRAQHDSARAEVERRHAAQLQAVRNRCEELERENRTLSEAKHGLDATGSNLSMKLAAAEGSVAALQEEAARLRSQLNQLSQERAELEVTGQDMRVRLHALEEKVVAQKDVIQEQAQHVKDLERLVKQGEERCGELRGAAAGHQQRCQDAAAEITKANQIIQSLSNELKLAKEKVRRKTAIMSRQEEEITGKDRHVENLASQSRELSRLLELSREEASAAKEENQTLKGRLEETKKVLQSNEQMIRWLNNQVNEAQLKSSTAVGRPPFRPTSLNLPSSTSSYTAASGQLPRLGLSASSQPTDFSTMTGAGSTAKLAPLYGSSRPVPSVHPAFPAIQGSTSSTFTEASPAYAGSSMLGYGTLPGAVRITPGTARSSAGLVAGDTSRLPSAIAAPVKG